MKLMKNMVLSVKCQVVLPCLKVDKLSFLQNSALACVNLYIPLITGNYSQLADCRETLQ